MSMTTRPPKTSALGMAWTEDFKRGYTGIAKGGGIITGAVPIVGEWSTFDSTNMITYPSLRISSAALSVGCWCRKIVADTAIQMLFKQMDDAALSGFYVRTADTWATVVGCIIISGTSRTVAAVVPAGSVTSSAPNLFIVTWASGDYIRLYHNGVQTGISGATYTGVVTELPLQCFTLGAWSAGVQGLKGEMKMPHVVNRQLSAQEVMDLYAGKSLR